VNVRSGHSGMGLQLQNVAASWKTDFILNDVSLAAKAGDLIGIVGSVGSGKVHFYGSACYKLLLIHESINAQPQDRQRVCNSSASRNGVKDNKT